MKSALFILELWLLLSRVDSECRYRDSDLSKDAFPYWASWGCYKYTRPDFFDGEPIQAATCSLYLGGMVQYVPGIQQDIVCQPFHHTNRHVVEQVGNSFWNNRSVTRWIECTKQAEDCCESVMADERVVDDRCPSVWDGWSCFRSTPSGLNHRILCSPFAYGYEPPRCHHYGYKECFSNSTWNHQTNYSSCNVTPPLIVRNIYYIVILSISTIFCLPALLVLLFTNAPQAQKLRIVRALLLAICIHNVTVILVRALIIVPELTTMNPMTTLMHKNTVACRCLTFFEKLTGNAVFCCMLLIGIFLHPLLTNLFRIHDRANGTVMLPYYIGAGIIAIGSAVGWAVVMFQSFDHHCWQVTDDSRVDWILDGPRLIMLCVNLILLLHITVRLWHAFNAKNSDENPFLRTLKAALICLPVFGIPFLFLIIRPDMDNCGTEQFYYIVNYTIPAAQGIFIAICHCYTERDVSKYFVLWWRKLSGICRRGSIVTRRSSVTETRHGLVEAVTAPLRTPPKSRPRSVSLPERSHGPGDTQI